MTPLRRRDEEVKKTTWPKRGVRGRIRSGLNIIIGINQEGQSPSSCRMPKTSPIWRARPLKDRCWASNRHHLKHDSIKKTVFPRKRRVIVSISTNQQKGLSFYKPQTHWNEEHVPRLLHKYVVGDVAPAAAPRRSRRMECRLKAKKDLPRNRKYSRFRLYGHRIYGLFGYLINFWLVPISLHILKLTIYSEFYLNFGYMVNF